MFYKILVGFKYHRRPWANIFDTNTCRSINIPKKAKHALMYCASKNVFVKDIGSWASMVLQKYQTFIEVTSNMIYIVAIGVGFKCPRKIHLNTWCPPSLRFSDLSTALINNEEEEDVLSWYPFLFIPPTKIGGSSLPHSILGHKVNSKSKWQQIP